MSLYLASLYLLSSTKVVNQEKTAERSTEIDSPVDSREETARLLIVTDALLQEGGKVVSKRVDAAELLHELCAAREQESAEVLRFVATEEHVPDGHAIPAF